jgi:hypothetical protein
MISAKLDGGQILDICKFVWDFYGTARCDSFLMFKRLKARAIHTELEPVDGPEAFDILTMKRWRRHFHQRRNNFPGFWIYLSQSQLRGDQI